MNVRCVQKDTRVLQEQASLISLLVTALLVITVLDGQKLLLRYQ